MASSEQTIVPQSDSIDPAASAKKSQSLSTGSLIASIVAGVSASLCCVGPLVLLTLGISGSWISNLSALEPYRPIFIGITLLMLGLVFRKLYLVPQSCAVGSACASPTSLRNQRIVFWVVAIVVITVVAFPWYGPFILERVGF